MNDNNDDYYHHSNYRNNNDGGSGGGGTGGGWFLLIFIIFIGPWLISKIPMPILEFFHVIFIGIGHAFGWLWDFLHY